jgi:hypothetical protein
MNGNRYTFQFLASPDVEEDLKGDTKNRKSAEA